MSRLEVAIVDYGVGNLLSLQRALEHVGFTVRTVESPDELLHFDRAVLPGVGAFGKAMARLRSVGLDEALKKFAQEQRCLVGICLGMQLLLDESTEFGIHKGLGIIPGKVRHISDLVFSESVKIPHIGWAEVSPRLDTNATRIFNGTFYFVHSYFACPNDHEQLTATCSYQGIKLPAVIKKESVVATQFHPEKSGVVGLNLLKILLNTFS